MEFDGDTLEEPVNIKLDYITNQDSDRMFCRTFTQHYVGMDVYCNGDEASGTSFQYERVPFFRVEENGVSFYIYSAKNYLSGIDINSLWQKGLQVQIQNGTDYGLFYKN